MALTTTKISLDALPFPVLSLTNCNMTRDNMFRCLKKKERSCQDLKKKPLKRSGKLKEGSMKSWLSCEDLLSFV